MMNWVWLAHVQEHAVETADVGFVERRVDFVEDAERARLETEHSDQERECRHGLFAAREQHDILQALARRLRDDVDAAIAGTIRLGETHFAAAAAEESTESLAKIAVDDGESLFEFLPRDRIELGDGLLRVLNGLDEVVALAREECVALIAVLILLESHHVDRPHGFEALLDAHVAGFGGDQFLAGEKLFLLRDQFFGLSAGFGNAGLPEMFAIGIVAGLLDFVVAAIGAHFVE